MGDRTVHLHGDLTEPHKVAACGTSDPVTYSTSDRLLVSCPECKEIVYEEARRIMEKEKAEEWPIWVAVLAWGILSARVPWKVERDGGVG